MTMRSFDDLLKPTSVALLDLSSRSRSPRLITARNMVQGGFSGSVFVNPRYEGIEVHAGFSTAAALPAPRDMVVIATPAASPPVLIVDLAAQGTRAAVLNAALVRGAVCPSGAAG
jgi:acetyltransferase